LVFGYWRIMKLYNTLTRRLEEFAPLKPPAVTMYVCGPTVYDEPHIGHARSAYVFDVLRRYLASTGYQVTFVRNVTDVDDKIIEKARQELGTQDVSARCGEVADKYLKRYHETMDRLGIRRPDLEPKATAHVVPEMTDLIAQLVIQGAAYEVSGDVYFSVRKFAEYGRLSNRTVDELKSGARVEPGEHKEDPLDFALWKSAKPGEPSWESPWGKGRPGWHIECSAMSAKYLGEAFDIHGGGVDLVFPHHENEIAQARAAGKPFARHWIHNGLLTVNGEKMSKSLGNFITVDQALKDAGHVDALKMFFLGTHYRSPLDYTEHNIESAGKRWDGLRHFLGQVSIARKRLTQGPSSPVPTEVQRAQDDFTQAMDDDLNTPRALAVLDGVAEFGFRLVDEWNKRDDQLESAGKEAEEDRQWSSLRDSIIQMGNALVECSKLLGLQPQRGIFDVAVTAEEQELFENYKAARKAKNFSKSDTLRKQLVERGFTIQDRGDASVLIPQR
jgi:cysteinyl-tRNA synthetase